jgi:sensor histidine kinase YesM
VEERTEALLVPSLILQPLVENSIKYALSKMASGGIIQISAYCVNNLLRLEVADNGPDGHTVVDNAGSQAAVSQSGGGVGIRNVQERLSVLYPGQYHFSTIKNNPAGLLVRIEIPIEEA